MEVLNDAVVLNLVNHCLNHHFLLAQEVGISKWLPLQRVGRALMCKCVHERVKLITISQM